ncbi:alpha/beta hydrolase [Leptospira langatensis]|uniref:Alpha/beta hydrolase n=1 Tax=Leptospira langatensis TaxID=2484983 RepID=A0A5F1ZXG5_9LEPT|nr:alpha/beta hydrolase [Leptospira langatensis]TGK01219.1 alpha/beta hydrolase [Leptospira langatensis]TGL42331.1 alpha/beta hydrolase [Leptospira langatensis]
MTWEQNYHLEDGTFAGAGDVSIYYRAYRAKDASNPRTLVVHHGIGEHGKRYDNLVEALSGKEYNIYLIDARGHGKSGGSRGVVTHFNQFLADLDRLIGIAKQKENAKKVTLLGHSMGALISLFYAGEPSYQANLDRLVLSGLPIAVKTDLVMNIKKGAGSLLAGAFPTLTVPTGLDVNALSHDKEVVKAYKKDPLVHGSVGAYLGDFLLNSKEKALEKAAKIQIPVYMFHGKEDAIALSVGTDEAFEVIPAADKTKRVYEGLYHETMNELPADKAKVLGDLVNWLQTH